MNQRYGKDHVELTLELFSSNEAFEANPNAAVAKILKDIANNIEYGGPEIDEYIFDENGNRVGNYCLEINEDYDE